MHAWDLIFDVVLLLAAAMVFGAVFTSLRQSAILGYLLAGTILGPNALHLVKTGSDVEAIAELGVALLLFSLGLEFSWMRLRQLGMRALVAGVAQVCLTGIIAGGIASLMMSDWREAATVGAMVALSSTACTLRVLVDRTEVESVHGRHVLGVLLVQDIAVVPLALLVAVLAGGSPGEGIAWSIGTTLFTAAGVAFVLFILLSRAGVRLLQSKAMVRDRDLAVLMAVVTGLGSAWLAHALGLSPALGAFVAGMALGASPFSMQIRSDVAAIKTVLLTLFFASIGMMADLGFVLNHLPTVAAVAIALIIGKALIVWGIMRVLGFTHGRALATGMCLAQVGEFAFVLANLASDTILSESTMLTFASAAIISLFCAPYLIGLAPRVGARIDRAGKSGEGAMLDGDAKPASDVVIIGFGPAGEQVAADQVAVGRKPVVLDLNPHGAKRAREIGAEFQIGDATRHDVLDHAGIAHAEVVCVTLPTPRVALQVCRLIRDVAPQACLVVRLRYHRHAGGFESLGAHAVIDEEQQVGRQMSEKIADFLQNPDEGSDARRQEPAD